MEGNPFIKTEADCSPYSDEFHNIETIEQLPSMKLQHEAGDVFEDKWTAIKQEHELQDDTDLTDDIKIEEMYIPDIVPCLKIETPSSVSGGDLEEDIKEEIQFEVIDGCRNLLNEAICPNTSNPAVRNIYTLYNNGGHSTPTVSGKRKQRKQNMKTNLPIDSDDPCSMLMCTSEKSYSCSICEAQLARKEHLKSHILLHTGEKPFLCKICEAKFARNSHLKSHMITHTGEKPHSCSICEAKFVRNSQLKSHMMTHTGEKPHSCSICEAKFVRNSQMNSHMITHTGKKPYSCSICQDKFARKSQLKYHMIKHTGDKPYSCSMCETKFARNGDLKSHMLVHTGDKRHTCSLCEAKFAWKVQLKRHMLTHTAEKP